MADSEKTVKDILAKWAAALPGQPLGDLGQKAALSFIAERPAYRVRLMTLYDSRGGAQDAVLPFKEGDPPPQAVTDIWSQPAGLEADFIRHETRLVVPVSSESMSCPKCDGAGTMRCKTCTGTKTVACPSCIMPKRKSCDQCGGLGKQACHDCGGKGVVISGMSARGSSLDTPCQSCAGTGGPPCTKCNGGADCATCNNERKVACKACDGKGGSPCPGCAGARQVVKARSWQVEYQPLFSQDLVPNPETPEGLLPAEPPRDPLGEIVFELESDAIPELTWAAPRPEIKEAADALLQKSIKGAKGFQLETRIVKQKLVIEKIPVYSVIYGVGDKRYSCWATVLGNKIVTPSSPLIDLVGKWVQEANTANGNGAKPEELLAKAAALAPWPWVASLKPPKRGVAAIAANKKSLVLPAAAVLLVAALVAANPVKRLRSADYQAALEKRFGASLPAAFSADDEAYLRTLLGIYEPLGVDASAARQALDANLARAEAERQAAQTAEAERQKEAEESARKAREAAAARASARGSIRFRPSSKKAAKAAPAKKKGKK